MTTKKQPQKRGRGRPPAPPSRHMDTRVRLDVADAVEASAEREGVTVSVWIAEAIEERLRREPGEDESEE